MSDKRVYWILKQINDGRQPPDFCIYKTAAARGISARIMYIIIKTANVKL